MRNRRIGFTGLVLAAAGAGATEFHVAPAGGDGNPGTRAAPLRTIQRGADLAQPGDVITVHAGVYRERVNPPRGGASDAKRIVYQAAPGEQVELRGSEVVTNWVRVKDEVWKATLPNTFFGGFNPYTDLIRGDWFNARGRPHHTGAVYLDGEWLTEAARLEDVLGTGGAPPGEVKKGDHLLNVAWIRPGKGAGESGRIPAVRHAAQNGVQSAPCAEGGECIGWIEDGDWVRYDDVDFGERTESLEIRASSETRGGQIQVRLNAPDGELLGACPVPNTGGWQTWASFAARIKPLSGRKNLCLVFRGSPAAATAGGALWFAQVDATNTTIWAQFRGVDPNRKLVEINVRRTVFYPDKPGRNFITVRGFALRHAATPWAPPTAEQIGLIGTHWSRGWIIESNTVSHSVCSGIALGKYGDEWDNKSNNSAEGYVGTINRALANGWNKETIGGHLVRDNTVSHCEQAGIVGSLGAIFSTIRGNVIHDIHVRRLFTGAEMAGIKIHGAIDTEISRNHIYRTCRGLWLDWMAQGTRVAGNLFHENLSEDLFVEVNHGPFVVDNNLFLSPVSLLDMSEGGAYAHNLFAGKIVSTEEPGRETPYHPAHATAVAGLRTIKGGDNRFFNNLFVGAGGAPGEAAGKADRHRRFAGYGLWVYDTREYPLHTGGNVYYRGAQPYTNEAQAVVRAELDPGVKLTEEEGRFVLVLRLGAELGQAETIPVTTARLGTAKVPGVAYEDADGSPLKIAADYFGTKRSAAKPSPGPFENPGSGAVRLHVAPLR